MVGAERLIIVRHFAPKLNWSEATTIISTKVPRGSEELLCVFISEATSLGEAVFMPL